MSKLCKECGAAKPLKEYYAHPDMADGHLNKCKSCVRGRIAAHRQDNLSKIREYDRNRPNRVERNTLRSTRDKERQKTEEGRKATTEKTRRYREKFPEKYKANSAVAAARRNGKLAKPLHCEHCEKELPLQGHHHSYEEKYWLDVIWLCVPCHGEEHKKY